MVRTYLLLIIWGLFLAMFPGEAIQYDSPLWIIVLTITLLCILFFVFYRESKRKKGLEKFPFRQRDDKKVLGGKEIVWDYPNLIPVFIFTGVLLMASIFLWPEIFSMLHNLIIK
jgi:cbb3-type cytochrome oxidase subunit 3